ncbi:hypothetical protein Btru_050167 [Bulinus truncatus]|nr:hypothetical protein Btru_050167 [Bulinus truncatus]
MKITTCLPDSCSRHLSLNPKERIWEILSPRLTLTDEAIRRSWTCPQLYLPVMSYLSQPRPITTMMRLRPWSTVYT